MNIALPEFGAKVAQFVLKIVTGHCGLAQQFRMLHQPGVHNVLCFQLALLHSGVVLQFQQCVQNGERLGTHRHRLAVHDQLMIGAPDLHAGFAMGIVVELT